MFTSFGSKFCITNIQHFDYIRLFSSLLCYQSGRWSTTIPLFNTIIELLIHQMLKTKNEYKKSYHEKIVPIYINYFPLLLICNLVYSLSNAISSTPVIMYKMIQRNIWKECSLTIALFMFLP
ncbi:hypothetical protein T02_12707 [Trichinella nativa]|uniref:Uncharacterized protein n=1 Tax=Trichinella nativa TaxID=6335 RepID=A0A0V1L4W1_9BILA|nr:hypothetical protein T02_12707 [Trichinella nativa]